ncbi:MarR family winged helix-turn-helix transcriptional regulator [Glycomyces tarimensis]
MHDSDRTANLLGALALTLTDLSLGNATNTAGVSSSGAAALVTLSANPGLSVSELGRRVGLTQSAAARMVDSLETDGLIERRPSPFNQRWVTVYPTTAGRATARALLDARSTPLTDALAALDEHDRKALDELMSRLLTRLYDHVGRSQYMCRLCDRDCCTKDATCPVGEAERQAGHESRH